MNSEDADSGQAARQAPRPPAPGASPGPSPARLARVVLLVHEHDEALHFYRAALGAEPIFDATVRGQRLLHIGFGTHSDENADAAPAGIWFLRATGADRELVGQQAGSHPLLVIYVEDCAAALDRFLAAGGTLRKSIQQEDGAIFTHVADLYGNELLLVELRLT